MKAMQLQRMRPLALMLILGTGLWAGLLNLPAHAQDAAYRLSLMEEQMRQLTGQIESLNIELSRAKRALADAEYRIQLLEAGGGAAAGAGAQALAQPQALAPQPLTAQPLTAQPIVPQAGSIQKAPGPQSLGLLSVPPGTEGAVPVQNNNLLPGVVETSGLGGVALPDPSTPDGLYQQAYEALLRSQFAQAEAKFASFMQLYPQHELAGNAQYWLGEAYYGQSKYKEAAEAFLNGYKTYPNGPKAPDTLLKLGMSFRQLGQKPQACTVLQSVSTKYPKAAEARKRAQAEAKRAGCAA